MYIIMYCFSVSLHVFICMNMVLFHTTYLFFFGGGYSFAILLSIFLFFYLLFSLFFHITVFLNLMENSTITQEFLCSAVTLFQCCLSFPWVLYIVLFFKVLLVFFYFAYQSQRISLQIRPANFPWNQSGFYVLFLQ